MKITKEQAKQIICCFFHTIDSIYGGSYHHIGDGDGISKSDAEKIMEIMKQHSDSFFKEIGHNFNGIEIE